jgi:tRNA uridine 5-carbamoylmethylation protein Kti12
VIVVVCGPPATGKTTVANRLRDRLADRGREVRVLDSDEFARDTYDRMYERVTDAGGNWIVAGTFYRRRWQEQFADLDDVFVAHLDADLETCLERNRRRDDPIDETGVHVVWREFDEPDADTVVEVDDRPPQAVVQRVLDALEDHGMLE